MMVILLFMATALGTGIRFEEKPCPHGEGTVRQFFKVSGNTLGGYDSDLAVYSTRGQFREHAVSTCPSSYFSVLGTDLEREIPEVLRGAVDDAIERSRSTWVQPDEPEVWERYDTAARIATALGRDHFAVAELYLNASWTVRDAAVGVYVGGLNGPQAAREILSVGESELAKTLPPESIKLLQYNLARVAHRGGFNSDRDRHIDAYLALTTLTESERAAGRKLRRLARRIEPTYQRAAALALQAAIATEQSGPRVAQARYQLADVHRRLGELDKARQGFKDTLTDTESPREVRDLAAYLLEEIGK